MPEITSGSLIQDWYDRYVLPKRQPMEGIFSGRKPNFGLGSPLSANPLGYRGPGITAPTTLPVTPESAPAEAPITPLETTPTPTPETMTPALETPSPSTEGGSWSDKLTKGLQDPTKMGLLGMGLSMMATPPRSTPYSGGEIIGNAGLHGLKFFQQAVDDKRKAETMAQTAEEHKLTREDRRQANEDRSLYYRDRVRISAAEQESKDEARKATAAENEVLDVPIDPAVAKHYGVDPKMTVRTFNKMQSGLVSMAKPPGMAVTTDDKGNVHIIPKKEGVIPGAGKSKTSPADAGGEGPGKTAAIALINKELVSQYLTSARDEISKNAPPGSEKMKQMVESLNTQDPTTGGPNEAKVREHLSPKQREEFDFVKRKAQDYSKTMVPATAVQKARDEWSKEHPAPKQDARYEEYRRVYEEIRNYSGWTNAEKNAKIKEMNDKARKMGLIK